MKPQEPEHKVYLGDGAYAEFDGHRIIVTTSNGVMVTNTIYLEPEVAVGLLYFIRDWKLSGEFD